MALPVIPRPLSSDTHLVTRAAIDIERSLVVRHVWELFEAATSTRIRPDRVLGRRRVDRPVKQIHRETGTRVRRGVGECLLPTSAANPALCSRSPASKRR
jgi:hypothetical protein